MRLSNEVDQNFVRAAVPDGAAELLSFLPSLGTAETMVFGESVNLPMRVILNTLAAEYRPHSSSAQFTELWQQDTATPELMELVFDRWRARSLDPAPRKMADTATPRAPMIQATRAELKTRAASRNVAPPHTPRPAPQTTAPQPNALAAQVRERLKAKAAAGQGKPQSLADVKSMLNSAFHKNI